MTEKFYTRFSEDVGETEAKEFDMKGPAFAYAKRRARTLSKGCIEVAKLRQIPEKQADKRHDIQLGRGWYHIEQRWYCYPGGFTSAEPMAA